MDKRPKWIIQPKRGCDSAGISRAICEYWRDRWMRRRIANEDVKERIRGHTLVYPIQHGGRVVLPRVVTGQMEMF